MAGQSCNHS